MAVATIVTCTNEKTVIAGNRNTLFLKNVKFPANDIYTMSRTIAGSHVTSTRNAIRIASLPKMYSARVSGGEVDLERVGAAIVGDEAGADITVEDEGLLLVENWRNVSGWEREMPPAAGSPRHDLHGAHEENQDTSSRPRNARFAKNVRRPARMSPASRCRAALVAAVSPITLVVYRHVKLKPGLGP